MVEAQKWVEKEYPISPRPFSNKTSRNKIKKIQVNWNGLESSLSLEGFAELEKFNIQNDGSQDYFDGRINRNKIVSLDLTNNIKLKELKCGNNELGGNLDLKNNKELIMLDCSRNKLTSLDLSECCNLKELYCYGNQLTSVEFLASLPCPEKMTHLNISGNNFLAHDLSFFSNFTNLESLLINNNKFHGSLDYLEKMNKLEELDISDTDINSGLRYLPKNNLEKIRCEIKKRPGSYCQVIKEELKNYCEDSVRGIYNIKRWKEANKELIAGTREQNKHQELVNSENSNPTQTLRKLRQRLEIYFPNQLLGASELAEGVGQKIDDLEQQIASLQEQPEAQMETHQRLVEQNIINYQSQIAQLQSEKTTLSSQINTRQKEIQKLSREKEQLATQKQALESNFNSLKQTIQEEKDTLKHQVDDLKQKIENITADLAKTKNEWESEKLAHQQTKIELNNLRNAGDAKKQQLQAQITALQEKNANLTLTAEEDNKIFSSQIQNPQKTIREQENVKLIYQQRVKELENKSNATQRLTNEIIRLKPNNHQEGASSPQGSSQPSIVLQTEKKNLKIRLKEVLANYQGIKEELRKKEGYLECLIALGGSEKSEEKTSFQQAISTLKARLVQAEQTKSGLEKQLNEAKEKLAESKGKLTAQQEGITLLNKLLKDSIQPSNTPNQEKDKLINYLKDLQSIQESKDSFFKEWGKLSANQQGKLIERLTTIRNNDSKWINKKTDTFTWSNRANKVITFVGVGLSMVNPMVGGGITLVSSAVDSVTSEIENSKTKEQEIFINFLQEFVRLERGYRNLKKTSDNLLLISNVSTFPEKINNEIKNLKERVDDFFQKYDTNKDNEIDDLEWEEARNQLIQHLKNNRKEGEEWELKKVKEAIIKLEKEAERYLGVKIKKLENHQQQGDTQNEQRSAEQSTIFFTKTKNVVYERSKDWWTNFTTKMNTPIQCWDYWECCGQPAKKDKGKSKEVIINNTLLAQEINSEQEVAESSASELVAQQEIPPKNN